MSEGEEEAGGCGVGILAADACFGLGGVSCEGGASIVDGANERAFRERSGSGSFFIITCPAGADDATVGCALTTLLFVGGTGMGRSTRPIAGRAVAASPIRPWASYTGISDGVHQKR